MSGKPLRVAIIGQGSFAKDVYMQLKSAGHDVVSVFTVPDQGARQEPIAESAEADGVAVFKLKAWRSKAGQTLPSAMEKYTSKPADLNVLAYCTQFIPMDIINHPPLKSIVYHPSILPRHRGASSVNWTLICGDPVAGFSIFWADDGLDTGPVLLQKKCDVMPDDTVDSLYNRFLYPEGVKGMVEAVNLIAAGKAPHIIQPTEGATYDPMLNKKDLSKIQWNQPAKDLHNFIRGMDKVPGAWTLLNGQEVKLYGSQIWNEKKPQGEAVDVEGSMPALLHKGGLLFYGSDGVAVNVRQLMLEDGKMIHAHKFGKSNDKAEDIELSSEEKEIVNGLRVVWKGILRREVEDDTDFFKCGAGSMDVTRLVEEVSETYNITLIADDVYMATTFQSFAVTVILKGRNGDAVEELVFDAIKIKANNRELSFPHQLFINNQFVDADDGKTFVTINPTDETKICDVACASKADVDRAVKAAKAAFEGEWGLMSARDRGKLLFKLADLMEQHKEELATLESLDSGAVYTLALKTHVGMSIETWRYFAGWCDKIQGTTIPINHARPNRNLTFTKREPIGVCGIITPWNYPLMMVSWKAAACLATGNTLVLKPANVTPLTALKLCELVAKAGIPPGVFNVVPGPGSVTGQAIADHPEVKKLGFTGSTDIGKVIMSSCADSNVKRCSLELGGKSPLIIFGDADLQKAVRQSLGAVFFNKGENCIAAGRLFVEETIHDRFVLAVVEETKKMVVGDPLDRSTHHGPQNHRAHFVKLLQYIETGVKEGAKLVYGGKQVNRPGLFLEPTIFTEVEDHMYIAKEESFGPIMIISKFKSGDVDGVLQRANATEYGLASGVFTTDIGKALRVSEKLHAGTVFINTYNKTDVAAPFGGFKQSGFGKDLGQEALNEYLRTKCVTVEY